RRSASRRSARRVLPTPAGPTSVSRRVSNSNSRIRASSRSRPMKALISSGTLPMTSARIGSNEAIACRGWVDAGATAIAGDLDICMAQPNKFCPAQQLLTARSDCGLARNCAARTLSAAVLREPSTAELSEHQVVTLEVVRAAARQNPEVGLFLIHNRLLA